MQIYREKNAYLIQGMYISYVTFWCVLSLYIFTTCVIFCYILISCDKYNNDNKKNNNNDDDDSDNDRRI